MAPQTRTRTTATLVVLLVASGTLVPTAAALAPDLTASGVGSFLVDATGQARGAHVASAIHEEAGTLSAFSVTGLTGGTSATTVFESVAVADFQQTRKIEGAGSAALTLVGQNAVLETVDAAGGLLAVTASEATSVSYRLPAGLGAEHAAGLAGHTASALLITDAAGSHLGMLVHVPTAAAAADASAGAAPFTVDADGITAHLHAGERALFRGIPAHLRSFDAATGVSVLKPAAEQHVTVLADLTHEGRLLADSASEFDAGHIRDAVMRHRERIRLVTDLVGQNALSTTVSGAGLGAVAPGGAAVVQHDLDYEVLPVQHAHDVAVYVNGVLVPTASSAAALATQARLGNAAAYALTTGGRTHVLTTIAPAALASGAATVTVVDATDLPGARPTAEAQAIARAATNVVGSFESLGDLDGIGAHAAGTTEAQTKFIGRFASGIITKQVDGATVVDHTDLETRTTVFDQVTVVGETLTGGERVHDAIVQVSGPATTLTAHDDLYGTTLLQVEALPAGRATQEVAFDLADGVHATAVTDQVVRLQGPSGYVGWLVVTRAQSGADTASRLAVGGATAMGATDVAASLAAGSGLLLLAQEARTGYAAMDQVARAIASGQVGGQALFGASGQAVTHLSADYLGASAADVEVVRTARGAVSLTHRVTDAAPDATSLIVDARGTALMSADADDVGVLVDRTPALPMGSARAVFEAGFPAYFVDASPTGTLLVVVNAAQAARAPRGAAVEIVSDRAQAARADAAADLFGGFDLASDGLAMGRYVQARTDVAAGALHEVTVTAPQGATAVFDAVRTGARFTAPAATGSADLSLSGPAGSLVMSDQTSAVLRVAADDAHDVAFVLSDGIRAERWSDRVVMLSGPNGFLGALVVADAAGRSVPGGSLVVAAEAAGSAAAPTLVARLDDGGQAVFRAFSGIETELDAAERVALAEALGAGAVAGQVIVQAPTAASGARLSERAGFAAQFAEGAARGAASGGAGPAVLHAATSFSSTMDVVAAATSDEVTVTLSSALEAGKTVLVSLDAGLVPGLASGQAEILFDGMPIGPAGSYADVLDAADDGGVAEYHVITSTVSGATQVLVSVPHFSTHTVTIRSAEASGTDVFLWVSIGLALVVVGQTAWMLYRRRSFA